MPHISGPSPLGSSPEPNEPSVSNLAYSTDLPETILASPTKPVEITTAIPSNFQSVEGKQLYFGTQSLGLACINQKLQEG